MADAWVTPYQQDYLGKAQNLSNTPYTSFGKSTAAQANPWQQQGWGAQFQRGQQGAPEVSAGREYMTKLIGGETKNPYAGQNPYLQQQIDQTTGDMRRNFEQTLPFGSARAARGDTFGGGRANNYEAERERNFQDSVGKTVGNLRFGDYTQQQQLAEGDLNRRLQASTAAPGFANVDYLDIGNMINAGGAAQGQDQNQLNAQFDEYTRAREWPFRTLGALSQATGSGGGFTATPETQRNTGANVLGGAMLGNQLLPGGWGAGIGGLLSLL
jgi:hypothetical protein